MSEILKPCPFCGEISRVEINTYTEQIVCGQCGAVVYYKYWDTRPIEDDLRKRIAELEEKQRWIPVSERLPEEFTPVLTIGKDELPITAVVDRGHWYSSFEYSLNVTHWMTLPEPPEECQHEPA